MAGVSGRGKKCSQQRVGSKVNDNKKILILIHSLTSGGSERVAVALSGYLANQDFSVSVVTVCGRQRDFYALDEKVGRGCLNLAEESRGAGKIIANIRRIKALRAVIRKENPDVIIGMMTACAVLSILAGFGLPVKVVASERNYPGQKDIASQWGLLRKVLYRFADLHVAQTRGIARWLEEKAGAKRISIIPNSVAWPIPPAQPVVDPRSFLAEDQKLILAVGSISKQKGFDLLIKTFSRICDRHPDWTLIILGEQGGKDRENHETEKLQRLIETRGLAGRIYMPGRAGNVGDWYERADLFVLSSRYEGFPNVVLEAMAAGCACIAFDCDTGPGDIIEDGINGILVPPEDTRELARAMEQLMEDAPLRRTLSGRAAAVRERFSEDRILGRWKQVLDRLIENNGGEINK